MIKIPPEMAFNLKYIDLFAGCGGLSWGLMRSGWKGLFAIEKDIFAFETLQHNLIDRKKHFLWPEWLPNSPGSRSGRFLKMSNITFRISSGLKTIIGKELITDDFIAVFELVKNSFDAQAKRVDITFDSLGSQDAKIVIQDNGEGMDKGDIIGKWLFVAYSAKKKQQDYRDKINAGRVFAGAKGIGRFSCDSLGEKLRVYTKKKGEKGPWNVLDVIYKKCLKTFQCKINEEFSKIMKSFILKQATIST